MGWALQQVVPGRGPVATLPVPPTGLTLGATSKLAGVQGIESTHAWVRAADDGVWVEDRSQVNGVYVEVPDSGVPLRDGDMLRIGEQLLRFDGPTVIPSEEVSVEGATPMGAQPPTDHSGSLTVLLQGGFEGDRRFLPPGLVQIGLAGDVLIPETDSLVSPGAMHACLQEVDGALVAYSYSAVTGRALGPLAYRRLREPVRLAAGTRLWVGDAWFHVIAG